MAKESKEMRDAQLITMFWSIVIVAAILAAVVTAGQSLWAAYGGIAGISVGSVGSAIVSGIGTGIWAGFKMGVIYCLFVGSFTWLSTFDANLAAYASMAFDSIDALVSFVTMTVCWWLDVPIHIFNPSFDSIMVIGPLVFGAYSFTYDLGGTLPRWLTINHILTMLAYFVYCIDDHDHFSSKNHEKYLEFSESGYSIPEELIKEFIYDPRIGLGYCIQCGFEYPIATGCTQTKHIFGKCYPKNFLPFFDKEGKKVFKGSDHYKHHLEWNPDEFIPYSPEIMEKNRQLMKKQRARMEERAILYEARNEPEKAKLARKNKLKVF